MRAFNVSAFDDIITGTASTWYSLGTLYDKLGSVDSAAIHTFTTNVSGTSPTLTVQGYHSADGQNWLPLYATPEISSVAIVNNGSYLGTQNAVLGIPLGFVRLQITLGGTSPQCRLKLTVTGRNF